MAESVQAPGQSFDYAAFVAGRQTIRRFDTLPVTEASIVRMIAAAGRAPSAHNRQPWRFRIVRAAGEKSRLAEAMGARLRADRLRDGDSLDVIAQDVQRSSNRLNGAPVLIIVCLSMADMDRYPDERRNQAEYIMAVQSTAMAAQNLLLAAHGEGLGACWMCAALFCPDIVVQALALPGDWLPQGIVLLGHAAEPGRSRPRKTLDDIMLGATAP